MNKPQITALKKKIEEIDTIQFLINTKLARVNKDRISSLLVFCDHVEQLNNDLEQSIIKLIKYIDQYEKSNKG